MQAAGSADGVGTVSAADVAAGLVAASALAPARRLWLRCAQIGTAAVGVLAALVCVPDMHACAVGGLGPLQDCRSVAEVVALFARCACSAERVTAALRWALALDGFAFVPAYLAFVVAALLALRAEADAAAAAAPNSATVQAGAARVRALAVIGCACMLGGALSDEAENITAAHILSTHPGTPAALRILVVANRSKTALLALGTLCAGLGVLLTQPRIPLSILAAPSSASTTSGGSGISSSGARVAAGVAIVAGSALALVGRAGSDAFPTGGIALAWTALLVHAYCSR